MVSVLRVCRLKTAVNYLTPQQDGLRELARRCASVSDTGLTSSILVNTALSCVVMAMLQRGCYRDFIAYRAISEIKSVIEIYST